MRRELVKAVDSVNEIGPALKWAEQMLTKGLQAGPAVVRLSRPTRNLDQNAKLWPMLSDVSKQVEWYGHKLKPEEWKDMFTAVLKQQKTVPGIDGGFVVIGAHTSKMTVSQISDLIELMYAFGANHGVKWTEKAKGKNDAA
jgi:hypothetical protein